MTQMSHLLSFTLKNSLWLTQAETFCFIWQLHIRSRVSPGGLGFLPLVFWFAWGLDDCDGKGTIPPGFSVVSLVDELILMSPVPSSLSQLTPSSSSSAESQDQQKPWKGKYQLNSGTHCLRCTDSNLFQYNVVNQMFSSLACGETRNINKDEGQIIGQAILNAAGMNSFSLTAVAWMLTHTNMDTECYWQLRVADLRGRVGCWHISDPLVAYTASRGPWRSDTPQHFPWSFIADQRLLRGIRSAIIAP